MHAGTDELFSIKISRIKIDDLLGILLIKQYIITVSLHRYTGLLLILPVFSPFATTNANQQIQGRSFIFVLLYGCMVGTVRYEQ